MAQGFIGTGKTVTSVYVWLADHGDTGEGIMAMETDYGMTPMVCTDLELAYRMRKAALQIAKISGTTPKLVKFSGREELALQ